MVLLTFAICQKLGVNITRLAMPIIHYGIVILLTIVVGCSSKPTVMVTPEMAGSEIQLNFNNNAIPLIRLRYPVGIDPSLSRERFANCFKESELRGPLRSRVYNGILALLLIPFTFAYDDPAYETIATAQILKSVADGIAKSQFYTLDFYSCLTKSFPANSIILEPAVYALDENGVFILKPAQPSTPTPIEICFGTAFVSIKDSEFPWGGEVHPLIAITGYDDSGKMEFLASNEFYKQPSGAIVGVSPETLLNLSRDQSRASKYELKSAGLNLTEEGPVVAGTARRLGLWYSRSSLFFMDMYGGETSSYQFDGSVYDIADDGSIGPMAPIWRMYANVIKEYLNSCDRRASAKGQLIAYKSLLGVPSNVDESVLEKLLMAEGKFQNGVDREYLVDTYFGEFGKSMRKRISAEYELTEARGRVARAQRQAQVQALAASSISSVNAMNGTLSPMQNLQHQMSAMNMMITSNFDANEQMAALDTSFKRHFVRVAGAQRDFTIKVGSREIIIRARHLGELRRKLSEIAQDREE